MKNKHFRALFIRKAQNLQEVEQETASALESGNCTRGTIVYTVKKATLKKTDFEKIAENLFRQDSELLKSICKEVSDALVIDGAFPVAVLKERGTKRVMVIDTQGYDYPRYVATKMMEY